MLLDLSEVKVEATLSWKKRVLPRWGGGLKTVGISSEKTGGKNLDLSKGYLVGVGDLVVAADDLHGDCEDLEGKCILRS